MRRLAPLLVLAGLLVAPPAAAQSPGPLVVEGPVRLVPEPGATLAVDGDRYAGVIEVAADGAAKVGAVDEVDLEEYVAGVAEMPSSWSTAALEAQAIAARTYALWAAGQPAAGSQVRLRYDICASVACQVYAGLGKADEPNGRWRAATRFTAGLVLVDQRGQPILARYSSTAGGRTRFNQDVFVGEGSFPFLVAVDTPEEEGVAPLYRWQLVVPPDRLARVLDSTGELRPRGTLTGLEVKVPPEGSGLPTTVAIAGTGGVRTVRAATFARAFSEVAERLYPADYPGRLPSTFPSSRFSLRLGPEGMSVDGRGFGHAVGMSQYGAKGLADAGSSAEQILAHYYGGLRPTTLPGRVLRVGVVEDARQLTVTVAGGARLEDVKGRRLAERVLGRVVVSGRADGALSLALPPEAAVSAGLVSGLDISATESELGHLPQVSLVLPERRSLSLEARDATGTVVAGPVVEEGPGRVRLPLPALSPGQWRIGVTGDSAAAAVPLLVRPPPPATKVDLGPVSLPRPSRRGWVVVVVAALAALAAVSLLGVARLRRHRG